MTDSMSYAAANQYLSAHPQYYPTTNVNHQVHIVPPPSRPEISQRKRPKYTRSKTGCMTCRVKKIKCDETKPACMRCTHGSRECTWPEGVPTRKKPTARRDSLDGRPSTAGSSVSEASTPPTREDTPPSRRLQLDLNLLPQSRTSDNFLHMHTLNAEQDSRRQLERIPAYGHPNSNHNVLSMIPETSYPTRYDQSYLSSPHNTQTRQPLPTSYRSLPQNTSSHWNPPEPLDYYSGGLHERTLLGHSSSTDHSHNRYQ